MQTAFTKLFNVRVPVVSAPMAGASGGALAAAVIQGGGLGLIGHAPWEKLEKEIEIARTRLGIKAGEPLPFGIGVIGFQIEPPFMTPSASQTFLRQIVSAKPAAIWLSFARDLKAHLSYIKEVEKELGKGFESKIMVMVGTLALAKQVASWGLVDVLVAQGTEAGGHANTLSTGLPTHSLLQSLHLHFSSPSSPPAPLILASGGLMTGLDLLSILPYSSGLVLGTAFLASPECLYSPAHKQRVIDAQSAEDTVRTLVFDNARGTTEGFGSMVDGRALRNLMTREEEEGVAEELLNGRYGEALKLGPEKGGIERIVVWAGTGVGYVKESVPAAEIVERIEKEAKAGYQVLDRCFAK